MSFFNLSPAQQSAAAQIYSGFYNYAIQQGADPTTATQFANIGLGVASGEGLGKANPWSSNPDGPGTSIGPFQLYSGGLGAQLNGDYSPQNQINVAASNMWGESGTGGTYNTGPWNAVGDTVGGGNDTYQGQTAAEGIGQQYASAYGLNPSSSSGSTGSGQEVPLPPERPSDLGDASTSPPADASPNLPPTTSSPASMTPSPAPNSQGSGGSIPGLGGSSGSGSGGGGSGTPIDITNAPQVAQTAGSDVKQAGQETQQGLNTLSSQIGTSTNTLQNLATNLTSSWQKNVPDWMVRIILAVAGFVILWGAIKMTSVREA